MPLKNRPLPSIFFLFFFSILFYACSPPYGYDAKKSGCETCHKIKIDKAHNLGCTKCHKGNKGGYTRDLAHKGLLRHPASIKNAKRYCAPCHKNEMEAALNLPHYTLENEIGKVWSAFFPGDKPPKALEIKGIDNPKGKKDLIEDLLARRCLRCHVYYKGDDYSGTKRGLGCSACHLRFSKKGSHVFHRPSMKNCLSCHYGNFVGWDFVGRFEKDFPEDFRAPFKNGEQVKRPYGLEWIEMSRDIHAQKGLICTDCHRLNEFHGEKSSPKRGSCTDCHNDLSKRFGHEKDSRVFCASCHAKWGFYDFGIDLLRLDKPDMEDWSYIRFQGESEVENGMDFMLDKINSIPVKGVWIKGFKKRRWWPLILGMTKEKKVSVIRPILDLSISYVNEEDDLVFENITPVLKDDIRPLLKNWYLGDEKGPSIWLGYTPHTIGRADIFRTLFIRNLLSTPKTEVTQR